MRSTVPVSEPGLPEVAEEQLVHAIVFACARADVETAQAARRSADTGFTSKRFSCIVVLLLCPRGPGRLFIGLEMSQVNLIFDHSVHKDQDSNNIRSERCKQCIPGFHEDEVKIEVRARV